MKKQQKRKEKEKAKQRKRAAPEKVSVAPSTLGGRVGEMVDRYRKMTVKEYNDVVELCHMHGVQLSKGVLGRGRVVFNNYFTQYFTEPFSDFSYTRTLKFKTSLTWGGSEGGGGGFGVPLNKKRDILPR